MASKENKVNAGELAERSFRDYYLSCKLLIEKFGANRRVDDLSPRDFEGLRGEPACVRD
ncbi:MAG: hypothetical protein AB7I48_23820 [Planctomycetaceae bacterium]